MSIIIIQPIFVFSHFSAWKEIALELRRSQHFKAEYYHSFNLLQRCFDFWKKYIRSEKERRYKEQVIKVTYILHCCKILSLTPFTSGNHFYFILLARVLIDGNRKCKAKREQDQSNSISWSQMPRGLFRQMAYVCKTDGGKTAIKEFARTKGKVQSKSSKLPKKY